MNLSDFVIETDQRSKRYGDVLAVHDINLRVRRGEIYGFLGLNGAAGPRAEFIGIHRYVIVILASAVGLAATFQWWHSADQTR